MKLLESVSLSGLCEEPQRVQALSLQDYLAPIMFCSGPQQFGANPHFLALVIFTDEAHSSQEMESKIFTISICGKMKIHMLFFLHITSSGTTSSSGPVFGVIIYSDRK
jgi:hypothetical protein